AREGGGSGAPLADRWRVRERSANRLAGFGKKQGNDDGSGAAPPAGRGQLEDERPTVFGGGVPPNRRRRAETHGRRPDDMPACDAARSFGGGGERDFGAD